MLITFRRMLVCTVALFCLTMGSSFAGSQIDLEKIFAGREACMVVQQLGTGQRQGLNLDRSGIALPPCSTFKFPNSMIALESEAVASAATVLKWDGRVRDIPEWNRDHDLVSAFAVSAVWFYQEVARRVGESNMKDWLRRFDYGNQDMSGGLTEFWLGSSLKISIDGQLAFLEKLHMRRLPISETTRTTVMEISVFSTDDGAVLRGKTGTDWDPVKKGPTLGWYVGSLTRPSGVHLFAVWIRGGKSPTGREARRLTLEALASLGLRKR